MLLKYISATAKRKVLFMQPIFFKTADLPKRKPKVIIDRRTLEREVEDEGV